MRDATDWLHFTLFVVASAWVVAFSIWAAAAAALDRLRGPCRFPPPGSGRWDRGAVADERFRAEGWSSCDLLPFEEVTRGDLLLIALWAASGAMLAALAWAA